MRIQDHQEINMESKASGTSCRVYTTHVVVDDVGECARQMIEVIKSTSWIDRLSPVDQVSYTACAERTIAKLVGEIFCKVSETITTEFGEYMVSLCAQDALESTLRHKKLPLAELFKEKMTGNPGFDFHTESHSLLIAFGEAKYSGNDSPYSNAITQICGFVTNKKDLIELKDLSRFVSADATNNAMEGHKAFIAAFSINAMQPSRIFENILNSEHILPLLSYPELYLIGVEVCASENSK